MNIPRTDLKVTIGKRPAPTCSASAACAHHRQDGIEVMMGDLS